MKTKKIFLMTGILLIGFFGCKKDDLFVNDLGNTNLDTSNTQVRTKSSEESSYFPLFQLFLGKTNAECDAKVNAMFTHFFQGTSDQKIYYESGSNEAYILDVGDNDVRSEGMSYGMMMCVQLNKKTEFDKLWRWAENHMLNPNGFFAWQCQTNGGHIDSNPAPDGEEYFAMALYFAHNRWGSATGIDYKQSADNILNAMLNNSPPMFGSNNLVCFQPVGSGTGYTDPSYHLPAFYELYADFGPPSQSSRWRDIATASRTYLANTVYKQTNGLVPDYSDFSGNPRSQDSIHADFRYDAWRTAMNITFDCTLFPDKTNAYSPPSNRSWYIYNLLNFFENKGPNYPDRYDVETGNSIGTDHSAGLIAANAAAARGGTVFSTIRLFAQEFWDLPMPTGTWRYYNGCLYMLSMLYCTGNYNIIDPGNQIRKLIVKPSKISLSSSWSGKHLTATSTQNDADIKCQPENSSWSSQDWMIEPVSGSSYVRLKNVWTGKYLNVQNQNENAKIVCYELNESWTSQQWLIEPISGNSAFRLKNVWAGKYLTVQTTGDYANILSQTLNTSWASQKWEDKIVK